MKKIVLLFISLNLITACFSQTRKGMVEIGASSNLTMLYAVDKSDSHSNDYIAGQLTPKVGYFINDNTSIGCNLACTYIHFKYQEQNTLNLGVGPYINYYFSGAPLQPYIFGETAYIVEHVNSTWFGSNTSSGFELALGVGAEYMIKENIALNGDLGVANTHYFKNDANVISIAVKFGFKFYL